MKTIIAALLGIAVGALIVFLCLPRPPTTSATSPEIGRYQHISTDNSPANEKFGLLAGLSDRVIDTATGKIYQRGWMLKTTSNGVEESVGFMMFDPVGMSTNAERTIHTTIK